MPVYTTSFFTSSRFGVMFFGWFIFHLNPFFSPSWEYHFLFMPIFSGTQVGHKTRPWCILESQLQVPSSDMHHCVLRPTLNMSKRM